MKDHNCVEEPCRHCGPGTPGEGRDGVNACPMGCADKPQVTNWYVTVFALYNGRPYTTKVVASGRSTVPGIIKVAEKQCADNHGLKDIPTLTIVGII